MPKLGLRYRYPQGGLFWILDRAELLSNSGVVVVGAVAAAEASAILFPGYCEYVIVSPRCLAPRKRCLLTMRPYVKTVLQFPSLFRIFQARPIILRALGLVHTRVRNMVTPFRLTAGGICYVLGEIVNGHR